MAVGWPIGRPWYRPAAGRPNGRPLGQFRFPTCARSFMRAAWPSSANSIIFLDVGLVGLKFQLMEIEEINSISAGGGSGSSSSNGWWENGGKWCKISV